MLKLVAVSSVLVVGLGGLSSLGWISVSARGNNANMSLAGFAGVVAVSFAAGLIAKLMK